MRTVGVFLSWFSVNIPKWITSPALTDTGAAEETEKFTWVNTCRCTKVTAGPSYGLGQAEIHPPSPSTAQFYSNLCVNICRTHPPPPYPSCTLQPFTSVQALLHQWPSFIPSHPLHACVPPTTSPLPPPPLYSFLWFFLPVPFHGPESPLPGSTFLMWVLSLSSIFWLRLIAGVWAFRCRSTCVFFKPRQYSLACINQKKKDCITCGHFSLSAMFFWYCIDIDPS